MSSGKSCEILLGEEHHRQQSKGIVNLLTLVLQMNILILIATVHGRRFKPTKRIDVSLEELKLQDLAIDERLRKPTLPEKLKDQQEDLVSHPPGDAGMPIPKSDRRSTAFSGRQSASKSKIRVPGCSRADRIQGHQAPRT
jgi:hypothetical protein